MIKRIKGKLISLARHVVRFEMGKYLRFFKEPNIPRNPDGKIFIHIGCGEYNDKRYINMDTRPALHIHVVESVTRVHKVFPKNYADLIYACHILEHVPYAQVPEVLKRLYSRLKPGGVLRLSVPNFETIVRMYQEKKQIEDILPPLMGGQGYKDNFHYAAFDKLFLTHLLRKNGFKKVRQWNPATAPYHSFDDWAGKTISLYEKEWPISLNLEGIK